MHPGWDRPLLHPNPGHHQTVLVWCPSEAHRDPSEDRRQLVEQADWPAVAMPTSPLPGFVSPLAVHLRAAEPAVTNPDRMPES